MLVECHNGSSAASCEDERCGGRRLHILERHETDARSETPSGAGGDMHHFESRSKAM